MDYCSIHLHLGLLIAILVFSVGEADPTDAKLYWESQLPNIPMPQPVLDALSTHHGNVGDHLRVVADTKDQPRATADEVMLQQYGITKDHPWATTDEVILQQYGVADNPSHREVHMNRTDVVTSTFFLAKDLLLGAKLRVRFKTGGIFTRFPPHNLAQTMPPLNSNNINNILQFFSIKPGSTEAKIMLFNLRLCERNDPINGNWQYCATSLDQLVSCHPL